MLAAFLLGFFGSFGHCAGMCSGISLLLSRGAGGWRIGLLHLGRLSSYTLLGLAAGGLGWTGKATAAATAGPAGGHGHAVADAPAGVAVAQGMLALLAAALALYMAIALLGRAPSPERLAQGLTRRWGQWMRGRGQKQARMAGPFTSGLLWGLLPCGLVWAALLLAVTSGAPLAGAAVMAAFGSGTLFLGLAISLLAPRPGSVAALTARLPWARGAAAGVLLLVGGQMALRGLAAWGWAPHQHLGGLLLW